MITLTPAAVQEVQRLQRKYPAGHVLRIDVLSQGCSGLAYQLEFAASPAPDEQRFDCGPIHVVIPSQKLGYIDGLALDYSEDLMGGSFRFSNPNATQTCSCGHSFTVAEAGH